MGMRTFYKNILSPMLRRQELVNELISHWSRFMLIWNLRDRYILCLVIIRYLQIQRLKKFLQD